MFWVYHVWHFIGTVFVVYSYYPCAMFNIFLTCFISGLRMVCFFGFTKRKCLYLCMDVCAYVCFNTSALGA